jgi:Nucleotidyl transferase AbiEii toxin, Type IV TA system
VLKGGFALELRLGNVSRTTRDLDLATLYGETDGHGVWTHLSATLEDDVDGDNFIFAVAAPRSLAADMAGRPGRVRTVFQVRATHPMPTELPEPPSAWRDDYVALTGELDVGARTIEEAMAVVRPVWRICVENGG